MSRDRELLAVLAHEVRSPVAALAAIGRAAREAGPEQGPLGELAALALAACRSLERLVSEAPVGSLRLESVDLERLVRETAAAAALGGARVDVAIEGPLPRVRADATRIRQVLDNLVANALAQVPPEDVVAMRAAVHGDDVVVSVTDTGTGIPREDQERIFEPGVRLDAGRPGSGLGLAISRAIAEEHRGSLTVSSAPGEGATFLLALPRTG